MPTDTDLPIAAGGLLGDFAAAGAIGWSGVHLARTLGWLSGESQPEVLLACALCLRAQDAGSVCLPLDTVDRATLALEPTDDQQPGLTWPDADQWLALLASSPLVAVGESPAPNQRPLRLVNRLLYLERNWQAEEQVRTQLLARLEVAPPDVDAARLERAIEQAFRPFAASGATPAGRGGDIRHQLDQRHRWWPGDRQDHHYRPVAQGAGRPRRPTHDGGAGRLHRQGRRQDAAVP